MDTTLTDPLIGRLLDGRYRVESRIARGGMASVYLALDVRLERTVAVKVMHPSLAEDPQFVQRFIGEAKSVARLSHPNIVQVFDQGTDGTHVYLSMEYIPGRSLREMLRARGRLPVREALEIVIPVLAALGAAHQAGLIHRDIKPENVLIADDGRVKVVDFGLARAIHGGHLTRTGTMIGTIGYMSPEQVTTGTADARSDVYAVGIMLFELLTGRQPYAGETAMSIAYRHVHENVPAPSSVVPGIPASVDALVRSATDRDPDRRPRDATAMLVAAVEVHRGLTQGGAAHPTPPPGSVTATAVHQAEDLDPVPEREERLAETMIQPQVELLTSPGTAEPRARRGPRPAIWFIGALTLLMLAGIAFSAWWFSQGRYVKVPDLRGQNIVVARQIAQRAGFEVKIGEPRFDDKIEKDRVLDTEPGAGAEVVRGSLLTLIPSGGPETIPVPKVVNLSEADARAKIAEVGLTVGRVSKLPSETVPRGQVIRTNPEVGTRVRKGGKVNLVISAGLLMPNVTDMTREQAEQFLREKGFNVQVVEVTDDTPPGTVIAQHPAGGAEVDAGATVNLTVSKGPEHGWRWPWEIEVAPGEQPPNLVQVPDVRYKNVRDAVHELRAAGFKVHVRKLFGTDRVVAVNPGGQQPPGTKITIWH